MFHENDDRRIKFVCTLSDKIREKMFVESGVVSLESVFKINPRNMTREERSILIEWMKKNCPHRLGNFFSAIATDQSFTVYIDFDGNSPPNYFGEIIEQMNADLDINF